MKINLSRYIKNDITDMYVDFYQQNNFTIFIIETRSKDMEFLKDLIRENFSSEKTNHCNFSSNFRSKCKYDGNKEYVYSRA